MTGEVIYDFGMNNGDDVEYYLLKAARVVGVEANRTLCDAVRKRFADEIAAGRLTILNVALSDEESADPLTFYLHKTNHVLSQLPEPPDGIRDQFEAVRVERRTPSSIIREFGEPQYVKIDVEHYDLHVLRELFAAGIFPPDISAESHSIEIFACLVEHGYTAFNLVEGSSVAKLYGKAPISAEGARWTFAFRDHSAGPFGRDIATPWEDRDTFFFTLAASGLGWKDIHASRVIETVPAVGGKEIAKRQAQALLKKALSAVRQRTIGRLGA